MDASCHDHSNKFFLSEAFDEQTWSNYLLKSRIDSLYNSWAWGEYKSKMGWVVRRLFVKLKDSNQIIGALQLQSKRRGPANVFLVQGGIQFPYASENTFLGTIRILHDEYLKLGWTDVMIINYYESASEMSTLSLLKSGYMPYHNNKMYSFIVEFSPKEKELKSRLTSNWRHNLKRAQNNKSLSIRWCETIEERSAALSETILMYQNLMERKSFAGAVDIALIKDYVIQDSNFLILVAEENGATVAVRVGYQSSRYIIDFLAASNELAKNNYANYLLLWSLIKKAEELGLDGFECGGIDPSDNVGVYNFKKGLRPALSLNGPLWCFNKRRWITKLLVSFYALLK